MNRINASRFNKSVRAIYNMSDRVVSAYSIVCTSDTTQTRMARETLQFYRSICEVIFKIQLIEGEKIKVKFCENQSGYTDSFTLMISFVFPS